jgi:hypothetical protein
MTDRKATSNPAGRWAAALAHDVGKYVARTARNLPVPLTAPLPPELLAMLVRDLYALGAGERASARFDRLVEEARRCSPPVQLDMVQLEEVRRLLGEVDALEPAVRTGEAKVVARVAALGREVEQRLCALEQATRSAS